MNSPALALELPIRASVGQVLMLCTRAPCPYFVLDNNRTKHIELQDLDLVNVDCVGESVQHAYGAPKSGSAVVTRRSAMAPPQSLGEDGFVFHNGVFIPFNRMNHGVRLLVESVDNTISNPEVLATLVKFFDGIIVKPEDVIADEIFGPAHS